MVVLSIPKFFNSITHFPNREYSTQQFPLHSNKISVRLNNSLDSNALPTALIASERRSICECFDLHKELVPYADGLSWQRSIVREKKSMLSTNQVCPDTLVVLQHHPVYTMGTGSSSEFLNFDIKNSQYDVYRTERGGEVTYHGPGQLVLYPIINLRNHRMDLHWYLRALEEVVIRVLHQTFSIKACRIQGLTGVWVGNRKVAAIGIHVSGWITFHGLALNVTTDLEPFRQIVPCGLRDCEVGSIKELLGELGLSSEYKTTYTDDEELVDITHRSLIDEFSELFQLDLHQHPNPMLECPV